jgi:hypothetical protein
MLCLLIKAGADLHAVNKSGKTAAQLAHDRGFTLIEQLLNRAAQQQGHQQYQQLLNKRSVALAVAVYMMHSSTAGSSKTCTQLSSSSSDASQQHIGSTCKNDRSASVASYGLNTCTVYISVYIRISQV